MPHRLFMVGVFLVITGCASTPRHPDAVTPEQQQGIGQAIRTALQSPRPSVEGQPLRSPDLVRRFYAARGYHPAWVISDEQKREAKALLAQLQTADQEGLRPEDYQAGSLATLLVRWLPGKKRPDTHETLKQAALDILLSDTFLSYASDLANGRFQVQVPHLYWQRHRPLIDPVPLLTHVLRSRQGSAQALQRLIPEQAGYRRLKKLLSRYRAIAARGGWPAVPPGPKLHLGDRDERLPLLRERLAATNDLKQAGSSDHFDEALERAIRRFQHRHGLAVDGTIGPETLAALNVSVEERIVQIEVNMERLRWLPRQIEDEYVLVNIPDYRLDYIANNRRLTSMNVVVGKPTWETPSLASEITYLILNPKWNVPPGIFQKELLGEIQKDPEYLKKQNMRLVGTRGRSDTPIDPETVDWSEVDPSRPDFRIVQAAGPGNSLGQIKFMFPNPFFIYLHDTPSKRLFQRPRRALSHGCVRVEQPHELATALFQDDPEWNGEKIREAIATGKNRAVRLHRPVKLYILYWTAWVDEDGTAHFRDDIYRQDPIVGRVLSS